MAILFILVTAFVGFRVYRIWTASQLGIGPDLSRTEARTSPTPALPDDAVDPSDADSGPGQSTLEIEPSSAR